MRILFWLNLSLIVRLFLFAKFNYKVVLSRFNYIFIFISLKSNIDLYICMYAWKIFKVFSLEKQHFNRFKQDLCTEISRYLYLNSKFVYNTWKHIQSQLYITFRLPFFFGLFFPSIFFLFSFLFGFISLPICKSLYLD